MCYQCKLPKSTEEFNVNKATKDGRNIRCRPCQRQLKRQQYAADPDKEKARYYKWRINNKEAKKEFTRKWQKANPEKLLAAKLKWHYKMSLEQYKSMFVAQDGKCKICKQEPSGSKRLCVDHNHVNGQIRGLLCDKCNRGIGLLKDNPILLESAAKYLRETRAATASTGGIGVVPAKTTIV